MMKDKMANIYKQEKKLKINTLSILSKRKDTFKEKLSAQSFHFSLYYTR